MSLNSVDQIYYTIIIITVIITLIIIKPEGYNRNNNLDKDVFYGAIKPILNYYRVCFTEHLKNLIKLLTIFEIYLFSGARG